MDQHTQDLTTNFCISCSHWTDRDRLIGLRHTGNDTCGVDCSDQWTWTDGSVRNSDPRWNWHSTEPNPGEECTRFRPSALFSGLGCDSNLKYICEKGATCSLSCHTCMSDSRASIKYHINGYNYNLYVMYGISLFVLLQTVVITSGFQYTVINVAMTWPEAQQHCESQGSHLASITSAEENSFLNQFATDEYNCGIAT